MAAFYERRALDDFQERLEVISNASKAKLRLDLLQIDRNSPGYKDLVADAVNAACADASEQAAELANAFYSALHETKGGSAYSASEDGKRNSGETYGATYAVLNKDSSDLDTERMLLSIVGQEAKRSAGVTIFENAMREAKSGAKVYCARVPGYSKTYGRGCSFCKELASYGPIPVGANKAASKFEQHYHDECTCTLVPLWDKNATVEGYDYEEIAREVKTQSAIDAVLKNKRELVDAVKEYAESDKSEMSYEKVRQAIQKAVGWNIDVEYGADPDPYEIAVCAALHERGLSPSIRARKTTGRTSDVMIDDRTAEIKNPEGDGFLIVWNQFKSVVFGNDKHSRNPQSDWLLISNIRCELSFDEMVAKIKAVSKDVKDTFPEITEVTALGRYGEYTHIKR